LENRCGEALSRFLDVARILDLPPEMKHLGLAAATGQAPPPRRPEHAEWTWSRGKWPHFIWGCTDNTFPEAWGRKWAGQMNARFDGIDDAHHFLQNTHGEKIVELILDGKR
jgi:hypothetical protein